MEPPELERFTQEKQNHYDALFQESIKRQEQREQRLQSLETYKEYRSKLFHDKEKKENNAIRSSVEDSKEEVETKVELLKSLELKEEECKWRLKVLYRKINEQRRLVKEFDSKKREIDSLRNSMKERNFDLYMKDKRFREKANEFESSKKLFQVKEEDVEMKDKLYERLFKDLNSKEMEFETKEKEFEGRVNEFELREKQFERRVDEFEPKERWFEQRMEEFELKEKRFEDQVKELELKYKNYFEGEMKELEVKENQFVRRVEDFFESKEKHFEGQVKELVSKQKDFEVLLMELETKENQFVGKENHFEEQEKVFETNKKHFERLVKEFESKKNDFEGQVRELESEQNKFAGKVEKLESKEKHFEERVKELDTKQEEFEVQLKELESKEKQFEEQAMQLKSKEKDYEERVHELDLKEKQVEEQMKDLDSKKNQYEVQMKELELNKAQFEVRVKEVELKEAKFKLKINDLEAKQNQFEEERMLNEKSIIIHENLHFTDAINVDNSKNLQLLFNLLKKHELICSQVSDVFRTLPDPAKLVLDTIKGFCPPHVECNASILRRTCNLLLDELKKSSPVISFHVKEEAMKLASEWKENIAVPVKDCLEVLDFFKFVATYEIGSSFNQYELQRLLYVISQTCQGPQVLGDNQQSLSNSDGRNLQLVSEESESNGNDVLIDLQTSSDPAKLVLEIIRNPILPQDEGTIIDESHIFLLDQLMRISPQIKPHVRDEALKLALELIVIMKGSAENSLVVLGFLLLLSNYGLVCHFNEEKVFKLVEFVAQYKETVELLRALGFADKISDFVQNLIMNQRDIEAVRFICAYKLVDKIHPVNLLRRHMEKVRQISETVGGKICHKRKVKVRKTEIASLKDILQCISDNNLESHDLVNEIKTRIHVLEQENQKENIVDIASESASKVEMQPLKKQNLVNEAITKIQARNHTNEAVSKNQINVQQYGQNKCYDVAGTMNQVRAQQCQGKRSASIDAVTMNQVEVRQHQEHEHTYEAVPKNKRPRTAVSSPQDQQYVFGMPAQFVFPTNNLALPNTFREVQFGNQGTNYLNPYWPRLPFR